MMKSISRILLAGVMIAALFGARRAAAGNGAEAFDRMKTLVGHWEEQKANDSKSTLDIELTSGGTALIERFHMVENGKPVEMITLYYLDGDQIKLTHYCMAGNQPTMRGTYSPDTKTLTFDLISISNTKSPNDGHMHHAVYVFLDNDHFKTIWTFQKDQKDAFTEDVTYVRK
jgi:hypothetical protein